MILSKKFTSRIITSLLICSILTLSVPLVLAVKPLDRPVGPRDPNHTVYVTSQEKYYDTIVPINPDNGKQLPWNDKMNPDSFQLIEDGMTEWGPGDQGYRGGRWWVDSNPNGYQDVGDTYLLCPLLGPGRPA